MELKLIVVWDREALFQLQDIFGYLNIKSPKAANIVRQTILKTIKSLPNHPEIFPLDKFKIPKNKDYRAFEKYGLRVSYLITETDIRILRIRHTSRKPESTNIFIY